MCFTKKLSVRHREGWEKYKRLSLHGNRPHRTAPNDQIVQEPVLRRSAGSLWSASPALPSFPAFPSLLQQPPGTSCDNRSPSPAARERRASWDSLSAANQACVSRGGSGVRVQTESRPCSIQVQILLASSTDTTMWSIKPDPQYAENVAWYLKNNVRVCSLHISCHLLHIVM